MVLLLQIAVVLVEARQCVVHGSSRVPVAVDRLQLGECSVNIEHRLNHTQGICV